MMLSLLISCGEDTNPPNDGNNTTLSENNTSTSSGGGNNTDADDTISDPDVKYILPKNFSFKYNYYVNGNLSSSTYTVKIGNEFYSKQEITGLGVWHFYLKYTGNNVWEQWEKSERGGQGWQNTGTLPKKDALDKIGGNSTNTMLGFMTSEVSNVKINGKTKSGTEVIAGVTCDKYALDDGTYYYDPVTKLFFKTDYSPTSLYEVTSWDTSVTNFAGVELP